MTRTNNHRLLICTSLIVILVAVQIFYYFYCSNTFVSLLNIPKLKITGNMPFYFKRPVDNSAGSTVNASISLFPQQPPTNSELSEVNYNVLRQTFPLELAEESERVAIVVPYRNRKEHLFRFLTRMLLFLGKRRKQYVIMVTEQAGNQSFNRAKLFNVAVKEIRKSAPGDRLHGIDCFIFHDVDKVPTSPYTVYECGKNVRQLATAFRSESGTKWLYERFLGAVTAFSWDHLEKINGASNIFFGWGGEDDDLSMRLRLNNITVDHPSKSDGIFEEFDPSHPRDKNSDRVFLISEKNVTSRWRNDGIKQTRYTLLNRNDYNLFVWILVAI